MDFTDYLDEHIYMYGGDSVSVRFRFDKDYILSILDWFGGRMSFSNITDKTITARVVANKESMVYWALQYAKVVEILDPEDLRIEVKNALEEAMEKYKK